MKKLLSLMLLIVLLSGCGGFNSLRILGTWENTYTYSDGSTETLFITFHIDGTYFMEIVYTVSGYSIQDFYEEGTYIAHRDTIVFRPYDTDDDWSVTYDVTGGILTLGGYGEEMEFEKS